MRKILLLLVCVAFSFGVFASPLQSTWRWRNDNGSQEEATWMAADTAGIHISDTTKVLRLRIRLDNTYSGEADIFDVKNALKYTTEPYTSKDQMGTVKWTYITKADTNAFVFANSVNVIDGEATTKQMPVIYIGKSADSTAAAAFPFIEGKVFTSDDINQIYKLNPASSTEVEFVIRATNHIKKGVTYYFSMEGTEVYIESGASSPKLVYVENNNPKFVNGRQQTVGIPANEDYSLADILKVNDADNGQVLTWSVVLDPTMATLGGFPTTADAGSAAVAPEDLTFNAEIEGEESFTVEVSDGISSDTTIVTVNVGGTSVNSLAGLTAVSVGPNPVSDYIKLTSANLNQYSSVNVIDITGKIVKSAVISNSNSVSIPARDLSSGIYFVQLNGSNAPLTLKVVK